MPDFTVRSDAVNVEQIMEQIRARIREKRGVDYTDEQLRELASVKLERFLDPRGIRSDLLEQFRRAQPPYAPPDLPNFAFEEQTLFESTRGPLRLIRKLLQPVLKLFFNPNPLIQALNIQSKLNASLAEREAKRDAARYAFDQLHYEVMHNAVIEMTRLSIEMKNLKMRLESLASRLEFNERRARALESVVVYRPTEEGAAPEGRRDEGSRRSEPRRQEPRRQDQASRPPADSQQRTAEASAGSEATAEAPSPGSEGTPTEGPGQRSRRRRRRRGRRGGKPAAAIMGAGQADEPGAFEGEAPPEGPEGEASPQGEVSPEALASPEPEPSLAADVLPGSQPIPGGGTSSDEAPATADESAEAVVDERPHESRHDTRTARPEPFEHTFGAQAHPAEPATSDPSHAVNAPEREPDRPRPVESAPPESSEPSEP